MSIDPRGSNHLLRDMASFLHFKTFYVRNNKRSYLYFHQKHTNDITRGVSRRYSNDYVGFVRKHRIINLYTTNNLSDVKNRSDSSFRNNNTDYR